MNPPCAKCKKTVYPVEKLNCLDKVWHKACFKCEVCNLKLTMQTYKGYNKIPYCKAHYPTTKFTAVADTPENMRLQKNTMQQSSVSLGKKDILWSHHVIATLNQRRNSVVCQLEYHKEYERERAQNNATNPVSGADGNSVYRQEPGGYRQEVHQPPPPQQAYRQPEPAQPPPQQYRQPQPPPPPSQPVPAKASDAQCIALYSYTAAEADEVSFEENDTFTNCMMLDENWMEATNMRTGKHGMLPSQYVDTL